MNLDVIGGPVKLHISDFPSPILRRIFAFLSITEMANLCATLDQRISLRMAEKGIIDTISFLIVLSKQRINRWTILYLLRTVNAVRQLILSTKRDQLLNKDVLLYFYRLNIEHMKVVNQLDLTNVPTMYLSKSRKSLQLAPMFPHLTTLELKGVFTDTASLIDTIRALPTTFTTLILRWKFTSYRSVSIYRLLSSLPPSTTAIRVYQPDGPGGSQQPSAANFYAFQQELPNLESLVIAYDSLLFDSATAPSSSLHSNSSIESSPQSPLRSSNSAITVAPPNAPPPHIWTASLSDISIRTNSLSEIMKYQFPSKLKRFNLLVSKYAEPIGSEELGQSPDLDIILRSLPLTLEELFLRNPPGPRPTISVAQYMRPCIRRLLLPPGWINPLEIGYRMPQLRKLEIFSTKLPAFENLELPPRHINPRCLDTSFVSNISDEPLSPKTPLPSTLTVLEVGTEAKVTLENIGLLPASLTHLDIAIDTTATLAMLLNVCPHAYIVVANPIILEDSVYDWIKVRQSTSATALPPPETTSTTPTNGTSHASVISTGLLNVRKESDNLLKSFTSKGVSSAFAPYLHRLSISSLVLDTNFHFSPETTGITIFPQTRITGGGNLLVTSISPSSFQSVKSITTLKLHLSPSSNFEVTETLMYAFPSTLTSLHFSSIRIRGNPFNTASFPPNLEEFHSNASVERQNIRWSTLPRTLRVLHVSQWSVEYHVFTRALESTTNLQSVSVLLMRASDVELMEFAERFNQLETLKIYLRETLLVTGGCLLPGTTSFNIVDLSEQLVKRIIFRAPMLKHHNLDKLIVNHDLMRMDHVRFKWTSFPESIKTLYLVHPQYQRALRTASYGGPSAGPQDPPLPATWNIEYLFPNETHLAKWAQSEKSGGKPSRYLSFSTLISNQLSDIILNSTISVTSLNLSVLDYKRIPKSRMTLDFADLPASLKKLKAPQFKFNILGSNERLILARSLSELHFAGGYRWNEIAIKSLTITFRKLMSLTLNKFVLNGINMSDPDVNWRSLAQYARQSYPALNLDALMRFRSKLPNTVTSIDLKPSISYHQTLQDRPLDVSEWTLQECFPQFPKELNSLSLDSPTMYCVPYEFDRIVGVPTLTRIEILFKCIVANNFVQNLPMGLKTLRLPNAVCAEPTVPLSINEFPKSILYLYLPCMLIAPPSKPQDIPPNLVRLQLANDWSDALLEHVKRIMPTLIVTSHAEELETDPTATH